MHTGKQEDGRMRKASGMTALFKSSVTVLFQLLFTIISSADSNKDWIGIQLGLHACSSIQSLFTELGENCLRIIAYRTLIP